MSASERDTKRQGERVREKQTDRQTDRESCRTEIPKWKKKKLKNGTTTIRDRDRKRTKTRNKSANIANGSGFQSLHEEQRHKWYVVTCSRINEHPIRSHGFVFAWKLEMYAHAAYLKIIGKVRRTWRTRARCGVDCYVILHRTLAFLKKCLVVA